MENLSKRFSRLSPVKLELLAQRLRRECAPGPRGAEAIPRRPASEAASPLSLAQERLWFLDTFERDKSVYNVPRALRLAGPLDLRALERSFSEIVARHETLRTTFREIDGVPAQVVGPAWRFELPVADLSGLSVEEREREVTRLAVEDAQTPFDLTEGPLARAALLRLGAEEYVILFTLHHIISDAWSTGVLVRELVTLYKAFAQGQPSPLPELSIQYADFARWQREQMQGRLLEEHLAYWKRHLADAPDALKLPADGPPSDPLNYDGARQTLVLSPDLTAAIKTLCRREKVTLFTALLAAFNVLFHYYSGQRDILVGTPAVNRGRRETEDLIGFFINTIVLRTDLSGDPTFRELLARVRDVALGAYAHQDLPFDKVVKAVQPARSLEQTPLFQVAFLVHNAPLPLIEVQGVAVSPVEIGPVKVPYEMVLHATDGAEGLIVSVEYKTRRFSPATIGRLLAHFEALVAVAAARPETTLEGLKAALADLDTRRQAETKKELNEVRLRTFKEKKRRVVSGAHSVRVNREP